MPGAYCSQVCLPGAHLYELSYGGEDVEVAGNAELGPEVVRTTEVVVERHMGHQLRATSWQL